ncbi:uncharacterized protein BP01DRAFT_391742 [Aspergillus saccharolyticus JOP 1030-1]|uniref:TLDc domain-containing protein n=1 Tax=Aspergillus saccharolyticus JOP 1030-1 TaxID=1450539 RepID=A0A318ZFW1_9EURO|nr:hypothetical protein BP01DRAFT_391742 [Aspergillus saccharolyticus JOP 1030-1]PYH45597.1 hypothetical protein BP01DRAFT_391742 [Aspergillus saccharolyticus JOP 1030-1]
MTSLLDKALFHLLFSDKKKKVTQFLRTTTPDTLLTSLHTKLLREAKAITTTNPQTIFNASCIRDPSSQTQPYWTQEILQAHLVKTHPTTTISHATITLLWSCFCRYAYHPFPSDAAASRLKLELPAFERAFTLLCLSGTKLLGLVEDDFGYCWGRVEESCSCPRRMTRLLRSISVSVSVSNTPVLSPDPPTSAKGIMDTSLTDEVIDAILPVCPAHPKVFPSVEQLAPLAGRLLRESGEGGEEREYRVRKADLAAWLGLILRVGVSAGSTWGRGIYYGSFDDVGNETEELARGLASAVCSGKEEEEVLSTELAVRGLEVLPNLEQAFHQLWATIFQPPRQPGVESSIEAEGIETATRTRTATDKGTGPDTLLHAISLFIPPFPPHSRADIHRKVKPITFHKRFDSTEDGLHLDLAAWIFQQKVSPAEKPPKARLVLFVGQPHPTDENLQVHLNHSDEEDKHMNPNPTDRKKNSPVVVGAFFPASTTTQKRTTDILAEPELLFQLRPSFTLTQCNAESRTSGGPAASTSQGDNHNTDPAEHTDASPASSECIRIGIPNIAEIQLDPATRHTIVFLPCKPVAAAAAAAAGRISNSHRNVATRSPCGTSSEKDVTSEYTTAPDNTGDPHDTTTTSFQLTNLTIWDVEGGPNYDSSW